MEPLIFATKFSNVTFYLFRGSQLYIAYIHVFLEDKWPFQGCGRTLTQHPLLRKRKKIQDCMAELSRLGFLERAEDSIIFLP